MIQNHHPGQKEEDEDVRIDQNNFNKPFKLCIMSINEVEKVYELLWKVYDAGQNNMGHVSSGSEVQQPRKSSRAIMKPSKYKDFI
ncbi:hypothetical protein Tco_1058645 [Tanacetum coccineum]|uniref:Uncharacterized protein n=1 Tax=Tanacetum coccineum TaxID=301880 RepID=A0ABQ5H8V5_9ASTR